MDRRQRREHFSDLPQPPAGRTIAHTVDDTYLNGLEKYIDALGKHITTIQDEELRLTKEFSETLEDIAKKTGPNEWEKRQKKEDHHRNLFLGQLSQIREKRKQFRQMLYDALQERRKLWDSMQIQKDDEDILRKKMNTLGVVNEVQGMKQQRKVAVRDGFSILFLVCQIGLIIGFALAVKYLNTPSDEDAVGLSHRSDYAYTFYSHIALMVFAGLGLLQSYMKKYGFSGIGYTFMLTAFSIQWGILVHGFYKEAGEDAANTPGLEQWELIQLGFDDLIWGLYSATVVIVALSGVIGKTTPLQQLIVAIYVLPFWGLNYFIDYHLLSIQYDLGGSMLIFTFASFFAIAFSLCFTRKAYRKKDWVYNESRYDSDLFALLGTVMLWVLWPSFNAAFAPDNTQYRVIINTVLCLAASTVFAFLFTRAFRGGKFDMHDIQRASLSGGIAMGSCTSFLIGPGGALTLGAVAGGTTAIAFSQLQPVVRRYIKLEDNFGTLSTYLIPAVIGGLAGVISTAVAHDQDSVYGTAFNTFFPDNQNNQAGVHMAVLVISASIGFVSALPIGLLFRFTSLGDSGRFYTDETEWEMPNDFEPHSEALYDDQAIELKTK